MAKPQNLDGVALEAWLLAHPGWTLEGGPCIARTFLFLDFAAALAFAVRVGLLAERKDHHPEMALSYGKTRVSWSTHDSGGVTERDLRMAEACDLLIAP